MDLAKLYHVFICLFITLVFPYKQNKKFSYMLSGLNFILILMYFFDLLDFYTFMGFLRFIACVCILYLAIQEICKNKKKGLKILKEAKFYIYFMLFVLSVSLVLFGPQYFIVDRTFSSNEWYNADTTRVFEYPLLPLEFVHPGYGILFSPILYGMKFFNLDLQTFGEVVCTAVNIVQIILYGISIACIGDIAGDLLGGKYRRVASLLFFTGYCITSWFIFIPESFATTLFFIVLFLQSIIKKNNELTFYSGFLMMLMNIALAPIFALAMLYSLKDVIEQIYKKHKALSIAAFCCLLCLALIVAAAAYKDYSVHFDFESLSDNIAGFALRTIPQMFFFPVINKYNGLYLFQESAPAAIAVICACLYIGVIFSSIHAAFLYYKNQEYDKAHFLGICLTFIGLQLGLHMFLGFGLESQMLYLHLYMPAFFFLLLTLISKAKVKKEKEGILSILFISVILLIANVGSFYSLNFQRMNVAGNIKLPKNEVILNREDRYYNIVIAGDGANILSEWALYPVDSDVDGHAALIGERLTWMDISGHVYDLSYDNKGITITKNRSDSVIYTFDETLDYNYFIFGMGNRDKIIFRKNEVGNFEIYNYSSNNIMYEDVTIEYDYSNPYQIIFVDTANETEYLLKETESSLTISSNDKIVFSSKGKINIPDNIQDDPTLLKVFKDVLINIVDGIPYPNFLAYETPWYRDGAMMAMVLKETNNLHLIKEWVLSIDNFYDYNNGYAEADNVGEVLYLKSLFTDKDDEVTAKLVEDAKALIDNKVLSGTVDFGHQTYYPTAWLRLAFDELGVDHDLEMPMYEGYATISWFADDNTLQYKELDRWQYLYIANLHLRGESYSNSISYELAPSMANFERYNSFLHFDNDNKMILNHAWSASENFLLNYSAE